MSIWKKAGIKVQITGRSKIAAAIITGALAVFIAVELAEFFKPEVVLGKWQLLWSVLCALGAGAAELISVQWTGDHGPVRQRRAMIVLFLLLPVATLTMMEFLHGTFIYNWTPAVFAENYVFMLVIYLVFFAITGNIHTPVTLANILCYIFGMVNHFDYYTGIIFRGYTYGTGDAIGKGGRYDNLLAQFGKEASACGFTILIDDVLSALSRQNISISLKEYAYSLLLYKSEDRQNAIPLVVKLRDAGVRTEFVSMTEGKTLEEYLAFGKNQGAEGILYLDGENVTVYDMASGEQETKTLQEFREEY